MKLHLELAERGQVKLCWSSPAPLPFPLQHQVRISAPPGHGDSQVRFSVPWGVPKSLHSYHSPWPWTGSVAVLVELGLAGCLSLEKLGLACCFFLEKLDFTSVPLREVPSPAGSDKQTPIFLLR